MNIKTTVYTIINDKKIQSESGVGPRVFTKIF